MPLLDSQFRAARLRGHHLEEVPVLFEQILGATLRDHAPVKRGKEQHEPDQMYLNPTQILLVEPAGTGCKLAQLIAQAK